MADLKPFTGSLDAPASLKPFDGPLDGEAPKPVGGLVSSAKQAAGSLIKGIGQAGEDFLPGGIGKGNSLKRYGQQVIDENPTAIKSLSDIGDSPWMAAKEAVGNAAGSMGSMLGARALGMGITAASPLTGPFAPATALAGQAIANIGPFIAAAAPSFGGIREKQIAKDPNSTDSVQDKLVAATGAGTVGLIEGKFGPQALALKMMTKEGRAAIGKTLAETTLAKGIGYGALKGAATEGAEELVQNPIEQLSYYDNPTSQENIKDTLFGGAMGALGGGVLGGGMGAVNQTIAGKEPPPPPTPEQQTSEVDQANNELGAVADQYGDLTTQQQIGYNGQPSTNTIIPENVSGQPFPRNIVEVERQDGQGTTTIDRATGPLSNAAADAVEGGLTASMASQVGPLIKSYPTQQEAQAALDQHETPDRMTIGRHPRATDRFSVLPKTAAELQALDAKTAATEMAQTRTQQVEQEDGNAAQQAEATVDDFAHLASTSPLNNRPDPTEAQKAAGNYAKAHIALNGLGITLENPVGSMRSGTDEKGNAWETELQSHYGYVKGSIGNDKDNVDVFIKPQTPLSFAGPVFVVDQINPETGAFDEHKAIIGAQTMEEAQALYQANYAEGWQGMGAVTEMPFTAFKSWVRNGEKNIPVSQDTEALQQIAQAELKPAKVMPIRKAKVAAEPVQNLQPENVNGITPSQTVQSQPQAPSDQASEQLTQGQGSPAAPLPRKANAVKMQAPAFEQTAQNSQTVTADAAQTESDKSVGKESKVRSARKPGETNEAYLARRAAELNAQKQQPGQKTIPTKGSDTEAARAALGSKSNGTEEAVPVADLPDAPQAGKNQVSKQTATFINHVAKLFGKRAVFVKGMEADGMRVAGNTVYLSTHSSVAHLRVFGHEMLHALKAQNAKAYNQMLDAVQHLLTDTEYAAQYKDYNGAEMPEGYLTDKTRAFLAEEWMADLSGNRFAEAGFWSDVFTQVEATHGTAAAQSIIARLRLAIVNALNKLMKMVQGNQFAVDARMGENLEQIRKAVADGFAKYAKAVKDNTLDTEQGTEQKFSEEKRQYKLEVTRDDRATASRAGVSLQEVKAVSDAAAKLGLSKAKTAELIEVVRDTRKRFPAKEGWAPIEATGVEAKKDDDGNVKVDKKGNPQVKVTWKPISYAFNVLPGQTRAGAKMDTDLMNKVADQFTKMVDGIYARANAGDKNAQVIVGHQTWYRNVAAILRREFGAQGDLFADLLGATSPNTPVDTNWRFAVEILTRFTKGEFDSEMKAFIKFMDAGGVASKFPGKKIRQASGKLYGMNSKNSMLALSDLWRAVEAGTAPKARNFALNLIGQSNMATIDVWAARMLRRAANAVMGMDLPRIPTVAEQGVSGTWNASTSAVTGEFGFGAAVLDKVSKDLAKKGIDLSPPDLQALAWFAEKELWTEKNWTSAQGEGGSFEENIEANPTSRYLMGISVQQGDTNPSEQSVTTSQARLLAQLRGDNSVVSARVIPTHGLFMGKPEEALDVEWTVEKGKHNPAMVLAEAASIAKEHSQMAIFMSRVLAPDETSPNARPGAEVYFKKNIGMDRVKAVMQTFTQKGLDGFTLAVDPRAKASARPSEEFIGLRIQYIPEFDGVSPETVDQVMEERRGQLQSAVADLSANGDVAFAQVYNYDTDVVSGENYDEYIDRAVTWGYSEAGGQVRTGQSVRERLERAAARIQSDAGTNGQAGVPDAGSAVSETKLSSRRAAQLDEQNGRGTLAHAVSLTGIHFSQQARTSLDGRLNGTGLKGAERTRLAQSSDPRLKERVYFYVDEGNGIRPESGVGGVSHAASLDGLYNVTGDPLGLFKSRDDNANETALLNAGYKGYYVPKVFNNQGVAVVLGNASRGISVAPAAYNKGQAPAVPEAPYKRGLTSKELSSIDLAAVQEVAPSAKLRTGTLSVDQAELAAARAELAKQGIELPEAKLSTKRAEISANADAIAKIPAAKRDDMTIGEFPGGSDAYNLFEARKMLPKPSDKIKKVTDSNSFSLWQGYDHIANVDGVMYGITREEDPDYDPNGTREESDDTNDDGTEKVETGKWNYVFSRLDDGMSAKNITTWHYDKKELINDMRRDAGVGSAKLSPARQPFYSALSKEIGAIKMQAAPAFGWKDAINGREGLLRQGFEAPPSEGMKKFYDAIVPNATSALLKKLGGGKLETVKLVGLESNGVSTTREVKRDQPGFTLTPALREKAAGGLPMFSKSRIVGDQGRTYTAEQLKAFKNVGFQVEDKTLSERAKELWQDAGKKLAQGIADQFAPVKALDGKAYGLLRLAKGASGAFEALLQGGKLKLEDNVYNIDTTQRGGVVDRLFKPLQGEHQDFMRWVAANRAEGLLGKGKENLFTPEDIKSLKTLADGQTSFDYKIQNGPRAGQTTRNRAEIYRDALATFNGFNKNVLDMAEQSGLIDGSSRKFWESEFYVPFYRVADDEDGGVRGMNIKGAAVRQQAFKALKGGKNALNADLLDNTLMNWAHLIDASAKNRAAKATIDAAEKMGIAMGGNQTTLAQMGASIHNKNGVVWFMDGGVKRYSLLDNTGDGPYIMAALTSLEYAGMRNPVMNAMSAFKHALTVGVTASPFFKVRNLIRDSVQVLATGPIDYNVAKNLKDGYQVAGGNQAFGNLAKSLANTATLGMTNFKMDNTKSDAYFRLLAGGGTIHFGTMMEGSEAKRVQALVESGIDAGSILDSDQKVKAFYRKFIEPGITAYNELGNVGETVNRAALYDQLRKQGMNHAEASLQARDLMDFSMQGSFTSVRFLTQVVPFMNARIQGLYKLGKAAKEDPARFSTVLGATALVSLSLLAAYSDDDDWKKRSDADRNNFWWFKFGGEAFRIPKPFEIGAIATLAERGFELAFDNEMTNKRFMAQVLTLLGDNLSMNPVPQLVKPIMDVYSNKNSFSGMPIENMAQKRLQSEYRFSDRTTMAARGASTAMNAVTGVFDKEALSPVQIDHMLQGYFGWLGTFVVSSGDVLARPATNQPTQAKPDYMKVVTGNMVSDLRDAPSRYVSHLYDQAQVIEKAYGTWRALLKEGKVEEAKAFREDNKEMLAKYQNVEAVKRSESLFNEMLRRVERNTEMDADAKRERIRQIQQQKDQAARRVASL